MRGRQADYESEGAMVSPKLGNVKIEERFGRKRKRRKRHSRVDSIPLLS